MNLLVLIPLFFLPIQLGGGNKNLAAIDMKNPLIFLLLLTVSLSVDAGPQKPVIRDQRELSVTEDGSITISLNHLIVRDPDNFFYPWGFTLQLYAGENYTFDGRVVTPSPDFHGTIKVPVTVNDGFGDSDPYDLVITVVPVNDPPEITGQKEISTVEETAVTLALADITVSDPDDSYPTGFTLNVLPGSNYTASGWSVTPVAGFTGSLVVRITVNDGQASSPVFNLTIEVKQANETPVITGQKALGTAKNQPVELDLSYLEVSDPDSSFPQDFTLIIHPAANYTFTGTTITPATGFTGKLVVHVAVNDGHTSSKVFYFEIEVIDQITITGQDDVVIEEDSAITLAAAMFTVYDPRGEYPAGYVLKVDGGENYSADGLTVTPASNFNGTLAVNINVSNGTYSSPPFPFKITVSPVNDAPEITNFPETPLRYAIGGSAALLMPEVQLDDPDDTHLILAEVGFRPEGYSAGLEILTVPATSSVNVVFDEETGKLTLLGSAPVSEYQALLRQVRYELPATTEALPGRRTVYVKLNDGKDASDAYERDVDVGDNFVLDIPGVFTPNNDNSNDTWKVKPLGNSERYSRAITRVFNTRGVLVFESNGFEKEWDGSYRGQAMPEGTYYFTIDLNLNYATEKMRGTITILR